jgi:flagellar protein FliO/FliZ
MTWMIIRLILSLAFVGGVLWFAARLANKRGLGQGNGLIEVVARQRMGRSSTVNVVRIADVVLVIGATEEQVTLLAEMDSAVVDEALTERRAPARLHAAPAALAGSGTPAVTATPRAPHAALAGSVFDRAGWGTFVNSLRERTVRR